jgi:23S rRNA (guanine2445-N2)-methyltransferase / 23S rRNA (guanine2069-N7)-methyltransferase
LRIRRADADALYRRAHDWSEHLAIDTSFAVDVGATQGITHSQYAALRVKDAIVDSSAKKWERPSGRASGAHVNLVLRRGKA